jgi:chromosome segregation ATPase
MTATMNEFAHRRAVAAVERRLRQLEADRERLQRQAENLQHAIDKLPAGRERDELERRAGVRNLGARL